MNHRKMNYTKYGISKNRYHELRYFCAQYKEWQNRIKEIDSGVQPQVRDDASKTGGRKKDQTGVLAVERADLTEKIEMVEYAAQKAGGEIWKQLLRNVTGECSFWYLQDIEQIPISRSAFFQRRKVFFFILSARKK